MQGNSVVAVKYSQIEFNTARRGGVFFGLDNSNTTVHSCNITNNWSEDGGVMHSVGDDTSSGRPFFIAEDSTFRYNRALFGGIVYAVTSTYTYMDGCIMRSNEATASGGAWYITGNSTMEVKGCQSFSNHAKSDGGLAYVAGIAHLVVDSSLITGSSSLRGGAFFASDCASCVLRDTQVRSNAAMVAGALYLAGVPYRSCPLTVSVEGSEITGNIASTPTNDGIGGVALLTGASSLMLADTVIANNSAAFGGFSFSRGTSELSMTRCRVHNNHATRAGSSLGEDLSLIDVFDSTFADNSAATTGGVFTMDHKSRLQLRSSHFTGNSARSGGVVSSTWDAAVTIESSTFTDNSAATRGGVLELSGRDNHTTIATCTSSVFRSNVATDDGGVFWISSLASCLSKNNTYAANHAANGGAIFAEQRKNGRSGTESIDMCGPARWSFVRDRFVDNVAAGFGGVLAWNVNDDQSFSPCHFCGAEYTAWSTSAVCDIKGNVAGEARDVVQSPLIDSIFVSSSQWMERTSPDTSVPLRANSTILQLDARSLLVRVETGNCSRTIEEMRVPVIESGKVINPPLVITGIDFYQQNFTDIGSRANIVVSVSVPENVHLLGSTSASNVAGEVTFDNLILTAAPGSRTSITFTVLEPTNIDPLEIQVQMRECVAGEVGDGNQCKKCPPESYSLDGTSTECKPCPENGKCPGGAIVLPLDGYWRNPDAKEPEFIKCLHPAACLGFKPNVSIADTEVGCAPGYFPGGRLCHACAQGYGRSGANACARCPDETWNIILVILGAVALVVAMTALIYFTRKSAASEKDLLMQMFKIFLSYFQFVSFALNLRVQWPTTLRQLFEVQRSTSSPDGLFVSLDCALAATDSGGVARAASFFGDGETADAFLQQELLYLCVPFIGAAIIASFWWGCMFPYRACCRKYEVRSVRKLSSMMVDKFFVSVVVMLFNVYRFLAERTFMLFACVHVGDNLYLQNDLQVKCYDARHFLLMFAVGLPALLIYVIGVPLGAYVMLSLALKSHLYGKDQLAAELERLLKRAGTKPNHEDAAEIELVRDHLKELQETSLTQYKKRLGVVEAHFEPKPQPILGFLRAGFNARHYYWECIIIFRKVALVAVVVFFAQFGAVAQIGGVLGLVYVAAHLQIVNSAYDQDVLNSLESASLAASWFIFFAAMLLTSQQFSETGRWAVVVLGLSAQAVFLVWWAFCVWHELSGRMSLVRSWVCSCVTGHDMKDSDLSSSVHKEAHQRYLADINRKSDLYRAEQARARESWAKATHCGCWRNARCYAAGHWCLSTLQTTAFYMFCCCCCRAPQPRRRRRRKSPWRPQPALGSPRRSRVELMQKHNKARGRETAVENPLARGNSASRGEQEAGRRVARNGIRAPAPNSARQHESRVETEQ